MRKCWEFNSNLPEGARKFKIIGLDMDIDYEKKYHGTPEEKESLKDAAYLRDEHMFKILKREVLDKNEKVFVYTGSMHAITKLTPPKFTDGIASKTEKRVRLGNYLFKNYQEKLFSIYIHTIFMATSDSTVNTIDYVLPFDGLLEEIFVSNNNLAVGFDIDKESPFRNLTQEKAIYRFMKPDWSFSDLADGYIFIYPMQEWQSIDIEDIYITESNFLEVRKQFRRRDSYEKKHQYLNSSVIEAVKLINYIKSLGTIDLR